MKKILALAVTFVVCVCSSVSYAGSIGNKIEPVGNMKFAITAEGNFAFDRDMESGGSSTSGSTVTSFEASETYQQYAKLIMGVTDSINIFAKLGNSKIRKAEIKFSTGENVTAESENNFLYGGGFNAVYKFGEDEEYFLGLNGDFSFYKVEAEKLDITGAKATNISGNFENTEYQVGAFGGMKMNINNDVSITPYLGVFWNRLNTKTDGINYTLSGTEYILTFDNDSNDEVGIAAGTDINVSKNFTLNVEGRFFAGNALSFGGTFRF